MCWHIMHKSTKHKNTKDISEHRSAQVSFFQRSYYFTKLIIKVIRNLLLFKDTLTLHLSFEKYSLTESERRSFSLNLHTTTHLFITYYTTIPPVHLPGLLIFDDKKSIIPDEERNFSVNLHTTTHLFMIIFIASTLQLTSFLLDIH